MTPGDLASRHAPKIALLAPRLRALAERRGEYGVDASDTRRLGMAAGVITGAETRRDLSWLAVVPRRAGLVSRGVRPTYNASGNRHTVYVAPEAGR